MTVIETALASPPPSLLSGRVWASLSACRSSVLLSILLKTLCLLIIHGLLLWTDMFCLHRHFIEAKMTSFLPKHGRAVVRPLDKLWDGLVFHKKLLFIFCCLCTFFSLHPAWCWDGTQTKQTNEHRGFHHWNKKRRNLKQFCYFSHISNVFITNFNILWKMALSGEKVKCTSQFNNNLRRAILGTEPKTTSRGRLLLSVVH